MTVNDATTGSGSQDSSAPSPVSPGRVAVVTGAASGIGQGLAARFAAEGMHVVMADVEEPALAKAAAELGGTGASVVPVVTDVADRAAVEALRDAALSAFGAVHVVCNNAGVGGPHGPLWECPPGEWDWVLGVNLDGIRSRRFYILTSDNRHEPVLRRGQEIVAGGPPAPPVNFV